MSERSEGRERMPTEGAGMRECTEGRERRPIEARA